MKEIKELLSSQITEFVKACRVMNLLMFEGICTTVIREDHYYKIVALSHTDDVKLRKILEK